MHNGYLHLKKDHSFSTFEILVNKDTLFYKGTWELKDKSPFLYFENNSSSFEIEKLNFTNKIYYIDYLIPCQDTTQRALTFNIFKRID